MKCEEYKKHLPELLLESDCAGSAELTSHAAVCGSCAAEFAELRATMALLDIWQAPQPSPYFDTRMAARMREERQAAPAGFIERMRARLLFGSNLQFRPVMAGALAAILVLGGGTFAGVNHSMHPAARQQASATVGDLQSLVNNSQTIDQMDQLLQDGQDDGGDAAGGSHSNP